LKHVSYHFWQGGVALKITDVKFVPVRMPLSEPLRWGSNEIRTRGAVLVQVETDEGITGLGEAGPGIATYHRMRPVLEDVLKPLAVGQNPLDIGAIWQRMFEGISAQRNRGTDCDALSGIDIALWDIMGKATGQPIFRLLGAHRTEIPAYWAPSLKPVSIVSRECEEAVSQGF
jgi:L-alanine-DL-glutamate epimerase-like enolase superfamily enzyme